MSQPNIITITEPDYFGSYGYMEVTTRSKVEVNGWPWGGLVQYTKRANEPDTISLDGNRCWEETHLFIDEQLVAIDYGLLRPHPLKRSEP
jgi:hypothetical protein